MANDKGANRIIHILLSVIAICASIGVGLTGYFLYDFGSWKGTINTNLEKYGEKVNQHIIEKAIKDAQQDTGINGNTLIINGLVKSVDENGTEIDNINIKLKKGGLY